MVLRFEEKLDAGAFAEVFASDDRVIKLFKRILPDPFFQKFQPDRKEDEISPEVFKAEMGAYELLSESLANHTRPSIFMGPRSWNEYWGATNPM